MFFFWGQGTRYPMGIVDETPLSDEKDPPESDPRKQNDIVILFTRGTLSEPLGFVFFIRLNRHGVRGSEST